MRPFALAVVAAFALSGTSSAQTPPAPESVAEDEKAKEPIPHTVKGETKKPGSILALEVEIPEEVVTGRLEKVLDELRREATIPGFRKGRAPIELVRRRLGKAARGDAVGRVIPECVEQIIEERKIASVGEPRVPEVKSDEGSPISFTVEFEVRPEVKLPDLKSIEVGVEEMPVTDALVDEQLEAIRRANSVLTPKEGKAKKGDAVIVDINVTDHEGNEVKQLAGKDVVIHTGEEDPPAPSEVIQEIAGKSAGENFHLAVPRTIRTAGEGENEEKEEKVEWTWRVALKEVKSVTLPDLDDEFAKDVGAFDSLKDLQAKIRTDLEEQESRRVQISAVNGAIEQLLAKTSFDAPATLVAQAQMQSLARDSEYLKSMGMTFKDLGQEQQDYWESSRRSAEQRVRADLILHAIGEQAKIEVTDADVEAEIERMAEQAGRKALAIRAQLEAQKRLDALREQIAQDKIREHLAGAVKLTKAKAKPAKAAAEPKRKPAKKKKSD